MIHLQTITLPEIQPDEAARFPFSVPAIRSLAGTQLEFPSEVTFLVGENGSGKSTLLEALACAAGSITVGSESASGDRTLAAVRLLAKRLKLSWAKRKHTGFFMRSEDFFGFVKWNRDTREEFERELSDAGAGLIARGRLYDRDFYVRLDAPVFVNQARLAGGRGLGGNGSFAPRWTFTVGDLW